MKPSDILRVQTLVPRPMRHPGYIPVTPTNLVDSVGNTWNGGAIATGTYTFRPADNPGLWPATARALCVLLTGKWAAANDLSIVALRRASGGENELLARAMAANIGCSAQGRIALDSNGYFYAVVANANTTATVLRLLGYEV
jgi:hypothetical protein